MTFYDAGFGFSVPDVYQDIAPVGRGAFGLVVRAQITPNAIRDGNAYFSNRESDEVAIKKLHGGTVFKDGYHAKQVYREITLLKQLQHPNLIKLIDVFISEPRDVYIVTEAMDCDLSALINGNFKLEEQHIMFIVYQIANGLNYMHYAGVLHRDLKPQNILVNGGLDVRICDLGLARVKSPGGEAATGYVTTRWYRAPEVMLTWQHYTHALDIWSLGCIFGELLNRLHGKPTFTDQSNGTLYYAVFPADSHVDHLKAILEILGVPPVHIIENITEQPIKTFVVSKIADILHKTVSVEQKFEFAGPAAVDLLSAFLRYDPLERFTAMDALVHPYLSKYRNPEEEFVRNPIDTAFEGLELPVASWSRLLDEAVADMGAIQDGFQTGSSLSDTEAVQRDASVQEDLIRDYSLDIIPHDSVIRLNMASMSAAVSEIESDREYLQKQLQSPGSQQHRLQILNTLGEVDSRLALYSGALQDPDLPSS